MTLVILRNTIIPEPVKRSMGPVWEVKISFTDTKLKPPHVSQHVPLDAVTRDTNVATRHMGTRPALSK